MAPSATTIERPTWHEGELRLQRSVGAAEAMARAGRQAIRDHLNDQHRTFYPQLPFVVLGTVDADGDVWATVRAQRPGFLTVPDAYHLRVGLGRDASDPADGGMGDGDAVGLLGIELQTRRRNRLNGVIHRDGADGFSIQVEQAYGNCPQYIQLRDFRFGRDPASVSPVPPASLERLDGEAAALVMRADTLFVASYVVDEHGHRHVDVAHRGGRPGFVRLDDDGALTIPDFAGNHYFNTLGNILLNPTAGLVFVDFDSGELLQMTGDAEVILDSPEIAAFQGAERLWRFRPRRIISRPRALPLRWDFAGGWSPNTLLTGDWQKAAEHVRAYEKAAEWRPFRIAAIKQESAVVRSFVLEPADGVGVVSHQAGQHLPIRVALPGEASPVERTYTISAAPSDGRYRISVKHDGRVSAFLHGLSRGDTIEARAPAGTFTVDLAEERPAVLIAAGIGITPMLAMLRHALYEGVRTRRMRPMWLIYAAHSKADRAFDAELSRLVMQANGMIRMVRFLSSVEGAGPEDYEHAGRVDASGLASILPASGHDFYVCGPSEFMQSIYDGLRDLDIADDRIHAEAFGPGGLRRRGSQAPAVPATRPIAVRFTQSGQSATWEPGSGSLLDLAERAGLRPAFSCREGFCGTCRTRVAKGAIAYATPPAASMAADEALICCSVPTDNEDGEISLAL
jgi:uncharacterized protein